jgi:hypothetical protein
MKLPSWDFRYQTLIRIAAEVLHSDGCSGVSELYHSACLEHDWWYRSHRMLEWLGQISDFAAYMRSVARCVRELRLPVYEAIDCITFTASDGNVLGVGELIRRGSADWMFMRRMQSRSPAWVLSPVSAVRFFGVRMGGRAAWRDGGASALTRVSRE